jgi:hypothetical protein
MNQEITEHDVDQQSRTPARTVLRNVILWAVLGAIIGALWGLFQVGADPQAARQAGVCAVVFAAVGTFFSLFGSGCKT